MNSGIHDAANLAWKLARALAGSVHPDLLASYGSERRPAILSQVDRYTDWLTRAVILSGPQGRWVLSQVLPRALSCPAIIGAMAPRLAMLDTCYRSSLITGAGPHLGCRAPDGELRDRDGRALRLMELVSPGAALLLFDDGHLPHWDPSEVGRALSGIAGLAIHTIAGPTMAVPESGWCDPTGRLWKAWRAKAGTAALIRPDGFVGWRSERPTTEQLKAGVACALGTPC